MSFFGNNNNSTGFGSGGGFGASTNAFGANNNNTATTGSIFGGGNTATSGGFGSGGGFGSATNSPFGAKTGFGSTTTPSSGGLFGGGNTSTAGGFGSGSGFGNTNTANTGFGSNTGGGLFGANKPATTGFGSTNTGGSVFGGGSGFGSTNTATTTGFGTNNNATTTGFGASANTGSGFGGFGSTNNQTANGTAGSPFTPFTEQDNTSAAKQTIVYQSITCQPAYRNKTFEELRLEDYAQGRRYGNSNGQAGSFGASTGFGGNNVFGASNNNNNNTSGGLFGNNNNTTNTANTSTGFGGFGSTSNNANTNTGGFGSSGGGLFGQAKPAGGLFGQQSTATTTGGFGSTAGSTGGLFGGGSGFGSTNNATNNTSGGLFGNNNNNNQQKTGFGGFGSTTNNTTTTGFGANNNASGGLFGNNTANNTASTGGLFGQNNQQQQQPATTGFGASTTGGGLFGNQAKAAGGLFGNTATNTTSGGLFGNNQQQAQPAQSGGLFGNNATNTGGSLFGNAQAKPAGGLFGNSTTGNTTGGLFGNTNNQQPQTGGGLFGNTNASGGSLFGNNAAKPATTSLFGNTNNNTNAPSGLSLFGNNTAQPNAGGNSLFGNSLNQSASNQNNNSLFGGGLGQSNNQTPQQNQLHASLTLAPYGNEQLFGSLGASTTPVGPLATPLTGAKPALSKTPSLLSSTRLNSPVYTPRGSFSRGGTYSYATPSSSFSTSLTPGASSLLKPTGSIGSNLSTRLAKSISMQNLRGDNATPRENESLLRPVPGSASSRYLATGSMRKLHIDRSLRIDLFSPPPELKQHESARENDTSLRKKVSFDNAVEKDNLQATEANALVRAEDNQADEGAPSLFRAAPKPRPQTNGAPEMSQINGTASLTPVPESVQTSRAPAARNGQSNGQTADSSSAVEIGEYWSSPSIRELKDMSRTQLSKIPKLTVGRAGTGRIEFSACDLTNTELDDILGNIVKLEYRSATVYPTTMEKPARGKGLNVPSTIYLENVLPKNPNNRKAIMAGKQPNLDRFVQSLRNITNTKLKSFDEKTGLWCFTVEHFTTYGFDEEDETEVTDSNLRYQSSMLSDPPATPGVPDETMQSIEPGSASGAGVDDTFEFKVQQRSFMSGPRVPGGFEERGADDFEYDDEQVAHADADMDTDDGNMRDGLEDDPFMDNAGGAVQAPSPGAYQRYEESMLIDSGEANLDEVTEEMPGSFIERENKELRSILKPTTQPFDAFASPEKLIAEPWEEQLQRTISPKKRDRQRLKDIQLDHAIVDEPIPSPFKQSLLGQSHLAQKSGRKAGASGIELITQADKVNLGRSQAFRNSMDLMNSLWAADKPTSRKAASAAKGFENPYSKKPRLSASHSQDAQETAFHESLKPSFATNGTFVYGIPGSARQVSGELSPAMLPLVGEHTEVRFARWNTTPVDLDVGTIAVQKGATHIVSGQGFPHADLSSDIEFASFAHASNDIAPAVQAWNLASVLFDPIQTACHGRISTDGMTKVLLSRYKDRLRLDALAEYWVQLLKPVVQEKLRMARTAEETALHSLTVNDVVGASEALAKAKNFRLATIVAQLPLQESAREALKQQIAVWRERNDWSEFSAPIRAIYSLLAGDFSVVAESGKASEDRVSAFSIAKFVGWDWKQSFALRLFYGGFTSCGEAIDAYVQDVQSGKEEEKPRPSWDVTADAKDSQRQDVLFSILRLLASTHADLEALFDAKNITGSYAHNRQAWQLATVFQKRGFALVDEKYDQLTVNFASELEVLTHHPVAPSDADDALITAAWVLLHLRNTQSRTAALADLLLRNGGAIPEPSDADRAQVFNILTQDLSIPSPLVWKAKAQHEHASPESSAALEALWLLHAESVDDAHRVLVELVGPNAIIEEEYADMDFLLEAFAEKSSKPADWIHGGAVYEAFSRVVHMSRKEKESRKGIEAINFLGKSIRALKDQDDGSARGLRSTVAITEMERLYKEEAGREGPSQAPTLQAGHDAMEVDGQKTAGTPFAQYTAAMGIVV